MPVIDWLRREDGASHGQAFASQGGLFADEAIQLLQQFYVCGNPQGVLQQPLFAIMPAVSMFAAHNIEHVSRLSGLCLAQ